MTDGEQRQYAPVKFELEDKIAVVTGAGSGIGRAIAERFAAAGATVICMDIARDAADATAAGIATRGAEAEATQVDVTSKHAVEHTIAGTSKRFGRVDVMCNIAGARGDGTAVVDLDESSFDEVYRLHFGGTLFCCQAAVEAMIPRNTGSIINMSSTAIDLCLPGTASYSVAKASVAALTRTLAREVGEHGIRVNALAPGFVPTPGFTVRSPDEDAGKTREQRWVEMAALNRLASVDDVASQALYLASDASAFIAGQILRVNGGATMPW